VPVEVTPNEIQVRRGGENSFRGNGAVRRVVDVMEVDRSDSEGALEGSDQAFWGVDIQ